ncbi:MAG: hypothetical protein GXO94_05680, partial [Nitrospirae bacterium]|nr:hypothetical protein [Nitrospirota bacterium]
EDFKKRLLLPVRELIGTEIGLSIWSNPFDNSTDGVINLGFPEEYVQIYRHHFFEDPVFGIWLLKQKPFIFSKKYCANPKRLLKSHLNCIAINFDFQTRRGIFHGLAEIGSRFGSYFTFSRPNERLGRRHAYIMELLIPHLHHALVRVLKMNEKPARVNEGSSLTKRELEVLRWTREGKTGWEISVIMKISENTVRFHIKNILTKLNAVNKTHAVAKAIEYGWIDL